MAGYQTIEVKDAEEAWEIRLARPEVKNAFNPAMIRELKHVFHRAAGDRRVRVIFLGGRGGVFCSGGDLNWMRESLAYTRKQNLADAENLYGLFEAMDTCKVPLVCAVEGFALGGGVGLVSVCDYVIARSDAQFSLAEVRVGLIPACIGPFVLRKIGESQCRALFLSSERFAAERARRIGLVHEVVGDGESLEAAVGRVTAGILAASPQAVGVAKDFIRKLTTASPRQQGKLAVKTLADIRVTKEAQEGLRAFLDKRPPRWRA
jgi:methylglutaconyl-CoA hydratase